jgi:hypothetical protein
MNHDGRRAIRSPDLACSQESLGAHITAQPIDPEWVAFEDVVGILTNDTGELHFCDYLEWAQNRNGAP